MAQKPEASAVVNPKLVMSAPQLWALEFQNSEKSVDAEAVKDLPLQVSFALSRLAIEQLGVEFIVEATEREGAGATFKISYRAVFSFEGEFPKDFDVEHQFKGVAAHVASSALYPYIRETIHSCASRGDIKGLVLPVVNFRELIDPNELEIPSPPQEREEKEEGDS